jgi:hypothetical protein
MDMDGKGNVWVLKPGHGSRGRGIKCYDSLKARPPPPPPSIPVLIGHVSSLPPY